MGEILNASNGRDDTIVTVTQVIRKPVLGCLDAIFHQI